MASQDPRAKGAEDLQFEKCLGRGYFGEVWQAQTKSDHKAVAVKKVRLQLILENQLLDQLKREVNILYSLQHPRIVRLYFHFEDKYFVYLGMEFCIGGSLFDKLQKAEKFTGQRAATYFLQTCEALDYLHHLPDKVIHRDIKPENILLDANDSAKLADFGWANLLEQDKRSTFCGTLDYLAPEMIRGTGHDESVDMWTMGVLLYEMLTGQSPFGSQSKETTCKRIVHVDLLFPSDMDQSGRDLIGKLCRKNPTERLKVREAMTHEFVVRFHVAEAGETSMSHGGYPPGAEKGITAAGDEDLPRPSVVARKLRSECEKLGGEKEHLMQAIQNMEDQIQKQKDLLLDAEAAIQNVRKERREVEALKQEQLKRCDELARKIEDSKIQQVQVSQLRAELATCRASSETLRSPSRWRNSHEDSLAHALLHATVGATTVRAVTNGYHGADSISSWEVRHSRDGREQLSTLLQSSSIAVASLLKQVRRLDDAHRTLAGEGGDTRATPAQLRAVRALEKQTTMLERTNKEWTTSLEGTSEDVGVLINGEYARHGKNGHQSHDVEDEVPTSPAARGQVMVSVLRRTEGRLERLHERLLRLLPASEDNFRQGSLSQTTGW